MRSYRRMPVLRRFWAKVRYNNNGCWDWVGSLSTQGYGRFWLNGGLVTAHRFLYESINGTIPAGFEIDHLCRNRACVNLRHLEVVTRSENIKRGYAFIRGKLCQTK